MKALLLVLLALGLAGQAPTPPRHDKYASDPRAYCLAGPPMKGDTHAHQCHCRFMCSTQSDGDQNAQRYRLEDSQCEMYCSSTLCRCHPEETCEPPKRVR